MGTIKKNVIGLTLSGGATKAFATFAVIEELQKNNVPIDLVSGSSAGAIIGAHFALFGEVTSLRSELASFDKKKWLSFADFTLLRTKSLIEGKEYRKYLEKKFGNKTFKDTKVPLFVTATNIISGKVEYINTGKIVDALIASSAYPGVFPPFQKGNDIFVDGGVLNNLPYEILFKKGADKVIAVNLDVIAGNHTAFNTSAAIVARSIDLMIDNAFQRKVYDENKNFFVFDLKFKRGFASTWNIADLPKKYMIGKNKFKARKKDFLKWLAK